MKNKLTVDVKMFKVGELGDCFLLTFDDNGKESNILIDCGSFRNSEKSKQRLRKIASSIKKQLKGKYLDVVVGTHQHNDHVSGFVHCEDIFESIVDQTWLSWLDNPKDSFALKIKKEQRKLLSAVVKVQDKLNQPGMQNVKSTLNDILGFYNAAGSDPELPAKGIEILKRIGIKPPRYLKPGEIMNLPGLEEGKVKVYVLGPPRNEALLFDKDPGRSETYDHHLAFANVSANRFLAALDNYDTKEKDRFEEQFPFNQSFKRSPGRVHKEIRSLYRKQKDDWRTIDEDWLDTAARLGLYLDSYTNNSSLVLAFELVTSGKVLLFSADAQTGNWLSWYNINWKKDGGNFTTRDLLSNTVLYKVGHHGSHNATLVRAMEDMGHPELVAMIPVDKTDKNIDKKNGWKMPAKNLYKRLKEKTNYRVLRMDDGYADECAPDGNDWKNWKVLSKQPVISLNGLYVQCSVVDE